MCVGVTVWFGWGGVVGDLGIDGWIILGRMYTTTPQPNYNATRTRTIQPMK